MLTEVTRSALTSFVEFRRVGTHSPSYLGEHPAA